MLAFDLLGTHHIADTSKDEESEGKFVVFAEYKVPQCWREDDPAQ
jgi:hypothetical protein